MRAYPLIERHRFVRVWPGDPALAIPARFPTCTGTIPLAGPQLVLDNLMDLTREEFICGSSIGTRLSP